MAAQSRQIDLLFGVKGGGSVNGESGQRIKSQIDGIVNQLNHSPYTISIKANETELIKIEQRLDNIRSKITSMPALDIGVAGGGENDLTKLYDKVVKRVESVATKNLKLPELNADLSETKTYLATVERLDKLSRSFMDSDGLVKDIGSLDASAIADMKEYMRVSELVNNQIRAADIATKALAKSTKQASTESMSAAKMLNKVYTSYNKFTNIKDYKKFNDEYQNLINELSGKTSLTGEEVKDVTRRINELENACFAAGVQVDTLGEAIEHKISDRLKYLIGQFAIDFVVQGLHRIYDNVLQIDSAMTELKKVTDEAGEAYDRFLTNAGKRAKELGASLVEVVTMTADYARLGYDVDEASNLADAAIIYRNVGDGLKNADEATDHLISTMKAFGIEASNSMRIVDAFNEVSNNFAVTSSDIGAGLQRSSAAMAAAGNSMEETIALFTAGNTIIRDADTMGTSLKTISMRLRSTKSDLEAMGEDTDGAAESVSSLRKELLALTGVDIQLDENTYKNTYEILQELSKVWDNLDDLTQANVLEKLFGKRQANVGAAILENFNIAEESLETAMNSAGSAVAENEKYLESIRGHLDQLTASFQTLSTSVLDSELVKFGVDVLRLIVDLLNEIFVLSHGLGDVLKEISPLLGEIVNLIGTLTVMAGGASLIDGLFGFKHVKNVLNIVNATKDYLNILKQIKAVNATVNATDLTKNIIEKVLKDPSTKYSKETMESVSEAIDKIRTAFDGVGSAASETGKIVGGLGAKTSLAIGAIPIVIAAAAAAFGMLQKKIHSIEETTRKITEAQTEYNSAVSELDNLNSSLEENEKRIKELEAIDLPTVAEQEELDMLKEKNELLEDQIEFQKQLVELNQKNVYDSIVDATSSNWWSHSTWGYSEHTVGSKEDRTVNGINYYSEEQGKIFRDKIREMEDKIAAEEAKGAKANLELIASYEETLSNVEGRYLIWREDILGKWNGLAGATDRDHVTERNRLGSIIDADKFERALKDNNIESTMANILADSRFVEIIKFLQDHTELSDIEDINARLAESFGVSFDASVLTAFKSALEAAGYTLDDVRESADALEGKSPVDIDFSIPTEELESAREAVKTLSSECKNMADAFKEQNENGSLSVDTILDVIDAGYAAALVIDQETGAVKLDAAAYKELADAKIAFQISDLQLKKGELEQTLLLEQEKLAALDTAKGYAVLAEAKKLSANIDLVTAQIAALEAQIAALNSIDVSQITQGIYGIGDAAADAKSKLSKLQSGMENLLSQTISWLKQEYNDAQEAQENYYESQIDTLEDAKDAAKDRWNAEKEAIEDAKDSYNGLIDAQIELLQRQKEADDYAKSRAEKEDAVADIENQLLAIENDDSIEAQKMRLELQEQLKEAKDELEELQSDREYELREQALRDEKDRYNDEIDAKLDAIEKQSEAEEKAYQDRIDRLRKYLDAVRDSEKTEAQWRAKAYDWIENREAELYQKLIEWNRIYGDGRDSTVEQWFKEAEGWEAWGATFAEARENLARYLYELAEAVGGIGKATADAEEKAAETVQSILEKLFVYRDELAKVGADATAKMVNDIAVGMSRAMINGIEFSEEMLNTLGKFIDEENIACLNSVNQIIGYLTDLKISGSNEFDQLWQEFRAAMIQMDKDSFEVLQGVLNNINTVTQAAMVMKETIKNEDGDATGVQWTNNGIETRTDTAFSEGGVVDYTGPAKVHGSHANPEIVFNAEQAAKLYNYVVNTPDLLKSAFSGITADSSMLKGASQINNAPSIGDININISGNADADTVNNFRKIAGQIREEVVRSLNESMSRRGIARSPRMV